MAQRGEGGAEEKGSEVMERDVWAGLEQLWHCGIGVGLGEGWGRAWGGLVGGQTEGASFPFSKPRG